MIKILWLLSAISSLTLVQASQDAPLYTIAAPNTFRPNFPYKLIVTIHRAPSPVDVKVHLSPINNDKIEPVHAETSIDNEESKIIELDVSSLGPSDYRLRILGSGGISFNKSSKVRYNGKMSSAFIQTDKAIYKPGQIVHFRVLVTDHALRPYDTTDSSIQISDPHGNLIKQWNNVTFINGVFECELPLSNQVYLGSWKINAIVKDMHYTKQFTIEEYVLPTFEVEVKHPSFATYNESKVIITIKAKYTYGKPVRGQVLVTVADYYGKWPCMSLSIKPFTLSTSIDSKAEVTVDLVKDLEIPEIYRYDRRLEIFAAVTEELTGRQQNGTAEITIYNLKYKLSLESNIYRPGLKYSNKIQISLQDNTPILEKNQQVSISYGDGALSGDDWDKAKITQNYDVPQNGEVIFEFVPSNEMDSIKLEANFKGVSTTNYIPKAKSLSDRYMQLELQTLDVKVGDEVKLEIRSTDDLIDPLLLQVIGRGKILHWEKLEPSKSKTQEVHFTLTSDMTPKVRVVVYYTTTCGEVVGDAVDFFVDGIFKTKVDLQANPNSVSPGDQVDVVVSTEPNAFVGLLAVDQSVLLLKTGNDISTKDVLDDLQNYEIGIRSDYTYEGGIYRMRPWRPSSLTTSVLFSNVGLVFLTNGLMIPSKFYYNYDPRKTSSRPPKFDGRFGIDKSLEPSRIRRHFPETFLWTNKTSDNNGKVSINAKAPDTITSFVITAFAMDKENGLGFTDSPTKLRVFRDFFVTLNLPYSVVRGEAVQLQAIVFNYLKEGIETQVTLDNEDGNLELVEFDNTVDEDLQQKQMTKKILAKAGEGTSVSFLVTAKKLGHIDINVKARSTIAADAIEKKLLVKAEGTTHYFNKAVLIDLRNEDKFEQKVTVDIPNDIVSESEYVEVSAISDIMRSTVNNLNKLLRMPYGCGEQNMLNFVPNIVIAEYLSETKQLNEDVKSQAIKYMETGYQRQLTYKRSDNSFSSFGNGDKNGSTWLTAFVVKSFLQATPYITIGKNVVNNSLNWLANHQQEDGSFPEVGQVFNKAMQGGSGNGTALTAYVLSSFLEAKRKHIDNGRLDDVITKATLYLEKEFSNFKSDYELVLATYVLHLANSNSKDDAFAKMEEKSKTFRDIKHWSTPLPSGDESDSESYYYRPRSVDVEMTSYALLTYVLREEISNAVPIMRWLITKRNENGAFESTQDTVMGIQALAKFASKLTSPEDSNLDVTITYEEEKKNFVINKETSLILHREKLPSKTRGVTISATGNGVGIVQVTWSYNVIEDTKDNQAFIIFTNTTGRKEELLVEACAKYVYEPNAESNMAVMEIALPSGYVLDRGSLPTTDETKMIKRVEPEKSDTAVVLYFDKITNEFVCTSVKAYREFKVAKVKPALVEVYDYYEPLMRAEQYYNAPATSLCDLCQTEECKEKENCA